MHRPCSKKQNDPHQQKKQFKDSKIEDKAKIFNEKKKMAINHINGYVLLI